MPVGVFFLLLALTGTAQNSNNPAEAVTRALVGHWAGYLEYRDYSEPPTSSKRVRLPTWLDATLMTDGLSLHYIYDDGPAKVVDETETVSFDLAHNSFRSTQAGRPPSTYRVSGFDSLHDGLGTLVLMGPGFENGKPADMRLTFLVRRNMLELLEEARPADSSEEFAFRHVYRLTRAQAPEVTRKRPR